MDEDLGVKAAPVTRLRRRLSVEAEDSPMPTTPSTPTKKRTTRLAAKPQLELIDEVVTENVPKKSTRKAAVKEAVETEATTGTPTPVTPSRRSTRIRSNTSILSEATTQNVESPRAKRALRRNSQLGSDTESTAVTPARQTRKTRKDSTTSIDKPAETVDENVVMYGVTSTNADPITEKSEKETINESKANETDNHSPTTRKSPRLSKLGGKTDETDNVDKDIDKTLKVSTKKTDKYPKVSLTPIKSDLLETFVKNATQKANETKKAKLSTSSMNIINELKTNHKRTLNKSTSAIEKIANDLKNKRIRTKSWTTLSSSHVGFMSDNEGVKEKSMQSKTPNTSMSVSGDDSLNDGNKSVPKNVEELDINSHNKSIDKSKSSLLNTSVENNENLVKSLDQFAESDMHKTDTVKLFEKSPENQQLLVVIEDSDSCSVDKLIIDIHMDGDQCVPVVANPTNESPKKCEQSVEPMDIDESMPINVTIDDFSDKSDTSKEETKVPNKRNSSLSEKSLSKDLSIQKSRKSSVSQSPTATPKRLSIGEEGKNTSAKDSSISVQDKLIDSTEAKSNKSSSISQVDEKAGEESRKSLDKSQRKSSVSIGKENVEKTNESPNKSKRKSSTSLSNSEIYQRSILDLNNVSKSSNKRTSSVSQTESPKLENSGNDNKSTLVISQLVSTNNTNNILSPNVTNDLSKSINGPDVKNKEIDKKNLSLNYLTSTPIQQKPLQKLAMQINTSIISPAAENKNNTGEKTPKKNVSTEQYDSDSLDKTDEEIKFKNKKQSVVAPIKKLARAPSSSESSDEKSNAVPKSQRKKSPNKDVPDLDSSDSSAEESDSKSKQTKKTPNKKICKDSKADSEKIKTPIRKSPASDSSESDDLDDEESKDKSKMLDDEASEASNDYESGDSQDEEDRQYEEENEIVEKGETLDSEEEFSNDSDYEKDSFLVSSDAEDEDMLSGTGDDLTLSDNELTMAAKSKKKFNERKLKQQKKASREMYEARHKNESANSSKSETAKTKKNKKRQRLESSTLESENENTQPKKNSRPRIDSSQNSLVSDVDESVGIKKKKRKRLSESVCDVTMNEKEITVLNQSIEKNDPLTHAIKQEPKTPRRHFNISTVAVSDNIEEVQVDSDASLLLQNETLDPLQTTEATEDVDSSSSDNTEIIQNYDSVLNKLSMQTTKVKTIDTSLNLNKKAKDSKNPVIDQLNLSQTKKQKKKKDKYIESVKSQATENSKAEDENSSDSIDMKLLFPEDSNDSEVNASQFKPVNEVDETAEDFIPLKKTEAKTNLHENMDMIKPINDSALNVSNKKNKNRKSSQSAPDEVICQVEVAEEPQDSGIKIFIDTTGTRHELDTSQAQTNSIKKKKNKKNMSLNEDSTALESAVDIDCTDGVIVTPVESSFIREKKKKKNNNQSFDISANDVDNSFNVTESHNEKKLKKKTDSKSELIETCTKNTDNTVIEDFPVNISIKSDKKKKKHKNDVSVNIEPPVVNDTQSHSSKKTSISVEEVELQTLIPDSEELPSETEMKREKKKKKIYKQDMELSQTIVDNTAEESDEAPMEMAYKSEKKSDAADTVTDDALTASNEKKKHKKNKKRKNKNSTQSIDKSVENEKTVEQDSDGPKKRKRNASDETQDVANLIPVESSMRSNEKKKRKVLLDDECIAAYNNTEQNDDDGNSSKKSKKNKSKHHENVEQDEVPQRNAKKRKNMDDESEEKVSKVSKQNSFDKIHVPRLPQSILNQLTDRPQNKISKKKNVNMAIATMPFVVEEAERRKNKPSNYLEQSVYLNDSPDKKKEKRSKHKRPKVLPFTPTALTSDSGYTSQFNINVLPREAQFVAQASNVENFRESFLSSQRIKKLGTFERCKIQRSHKISKF